MLKIKNILFFILLFYGTSVSAFDLKNSTTQFLQSGKQLITVNNGILIAVAALGVYGLFKIACSANAKIRELYKTINELLEEERTQQKIRKRRRERIQRIAQRLGKPFVKFHNTISDRVKKKKSEMGTQLAKRMLIRKFVEIFP